MEAPRQFEEDPAATGQPESIGAALPGVEVDFASITDSEPALQDPASHVGPAPWERRQPQFAKRSVLPVEFFRRMPGGGTTYAPVDGAHGEQADDTAEQA